MQEEVAIVNAYTTFNQVVISGCMEILLKVPKIAM